MTIERWIKAHTKDLSDKRIAVTGSTGGLGRELCGYLASLGATLILLDRNAERSLSHKESLEQRFPTARVTCIPLDLEDLLSVEQATVQLEQIGIDLLIHNAGAYRIPRKICPSGYENVFQINFASPYYMLCRLLPHLRLRGGKAVVVGSIAHRYSKIDERDVEFRTRKAPSKVYGNAKRYLMFASFGLFQNEREAHLSVVHPGITLTNMTAHFPKPVWLLIRYPMKLLFMKPKRAVLSVLVGIFSDPADGEWIGPALFDIWGLPSKKKLHSCREKEQKQIHAIAQTVYRQCEAYVFSHSRRD